MIDTPVGQRMEKAMEAYVAERTMPEVEKAMQEAQIPCQRVYDLEDCLNTFTGMLVEQLWNGMTQWWDT